MGKNDDVPFCKNCYEDLPARHFALSRRSDVMSIKQIEEKTVKAIDVLSDEILLQACSLPCWQETEAEIIKAFVLQETYPTFAWTASCSSCAKPVNRTQPYVSLNRCEMEVIEKPWMAVGKVFDDQEFAVLCNDCCMPTFPDAEAERREMGMDTTATALATRPETVTD